MGTGTRTGAVDGVDMQWVVSMWVEQFVGHTPQVQGVALIRGHLICCIETDVGAECAAGVTWWWGALLQWRGGIWEHTDGRDKEPDPGEDVQAEMVRVAWWQAYREIGDKMNEAICKCFPQAAHAGTER